MIGRTRDSIYPMFAVKLDLLIKDRGTSYNRNMKLALKYGIAVTIVIAAWVALKHFVLHLEGPTAQMADIVVFNLAAITGLTLGIREKRKLNGGTLTFGDGWVTGIKIAVTYAILTSAYFAILLVVVGPKLMQQEGETSVVKAFLGLSITFVFFGAVLSAIIALIFRKNLATNIGGC